MSDFTNSYIRMDIKVLQRVVLFLFFNMLLKINFAHKIAIFHYFSISIDKDELVTIRTSH